MTSWHFGDRERACVVTKACCICTSSWWLHVALALWAKAWMWLAVERASHLAAWYSLGLSATDSCSHYYKCTQLTHIMQREGKKSGGRRSGEGNGDHLIISCFYQGTGFTTELRLIIRQYLWLVWVLWKSLKHCAFNMKTSPIMNLVKEKNVNTLCQSSSSAIQFGFLFAIQITLLVPRM